VKLCQDACDDGSWVKLNIQSKDMNITSGFKKMVIMIILEEYNAYVMLLTNKTLHSKACL
jgi:hypothetical protein